MEFSSLMSDQGVWADISMKWNYAKRNVSKIVDACKMVVTINEFLASTSVGIGGTIAFARTVDEAEYLYHVYHRLYRFVDGIHYELDELIDIPFTKKFESLIQEAYDINPKEFRTKDNFLFFPCGNSLEELLVEMVSTEDLAESYETMLKNLDGDIVDEELLGAFEVAQYWEKQYELAVEVRDIHSRYMNKYEEEWENLSPDGKLAVLSEYAIEVGNVIDERCWVTRVVNHDYVVAVEWNINNPKHNPESTDLAYTYPLAGTGIIYLNADAITDTSRYDLELTLNLVAHETRHLYQGQAKKDPEAFDIPVLITDTWITDEKIVYQRKPWEIDARAFAALTASY